MKNMLLLCSTMVITVSTLNSFDEGIKALKKAVPKGVSPSPSQELFQKLKREVQRSAPYQTLNSTFTEYKRSLTGNAKKSTKGSQMLPLARKSVAQFERALRKKVTYQQLENLLGYIETYN